MARGQLTRFVEALPASWEQSDHSGGNDKLSVVAINEPPTCNVCGHTDWRVAVTESAGSRYHVECWSGCGPS